MKRTFVSIFAISAVLTACTEKSSSESVEAVEGEVTSTVAAGSQSEAELEKELDLAEFEKEEEERIKKMEATVTTLKFDKMTHDFGNVSHGSTNKTKFKVTNTGNHPLMITDVRASCGCTTPKKPEKPIEPGKSDFIEVAFEPKPDQTNEINKTITVTANTSEKIHKLDIRAFVK